RTEFYQPNGAARRNTAPPKTPGPAGVSSFALDPLTLRPGPARETAGGKLVLAATVLRGGAARRARPLTNSPPGRRQAAAALARCAGVPPAEAEQALGKVFAAAREALRLSAQAQAQRAPLRDVVAAWAPGAWGLVCRTRRGAWSEVRGE